MDDTNAAQVEDERPEGARRRTRRHRGPFLLTAGAGVLAASVGLTFVLTNRGETPSLDGARLLADEAGDRAAADPLGPMPVADETLEDLRMGDASRLTPGEGEAFFVLAEGTLVSSTPGGEVTEAASTGGWATSGMPAAFAVSGDLAFAAPAAGSDSPTGGSPVLIQTYGISDTDLDDIPDLHAAFDVGALTFSTDGNVLVANRDETQIDLLDADGTTTRLLGPADDDEAAANWDAPNGRIVAMLALNDERVVFVMSADGSERLFLLDNTRVAEIDTGTAHPSRGTTPSEPAPQGDGELSPITTPLAPAPDGRVLTIGLADDGHAVVSAVDVDSGDVEVLADLEGVDPSIDQPVSAVAVGDDLIFLAEDKLWMKEGVFG